MKSLTTQWNVKPGDLYNPKCFYLLTVMFAIETFTKCVECRIITIAQIIKYKYIFSSIQTMNRVMMLMTLFEQGLHFHFRSTVFDLLLHTILAIALLRPLLFLLFTVWPMSHVWRDAWQRRIAQPQLKGDCLAPCSLKRWIIGLHHEQQHWSPYRQITWDRQPRRRGDHMSDKRGRKAQITRERGNTRLDEDVLVQMLKRGNTRRGASPLVTVECTGGGVRGSGCGGEGGWWACEWGTFIIIGSYLHLLLNLTSLPYHWHKSWFLHNRSPFRHGGEECAAHIDFGLSTLLLPTFRLSTVMHNHYQTLLIWNLWDAR